MGESSAEDKIKYTPVCPKCKKVCYGDGRWVCWDCFTALRTRNKELSKSLISQGYKWMDRYKTLETGVEEVACEMENRDDFCCGTIDCTDLRNLIKAKKAI